MNEPTMLPFHGGDYPLGTVECGPGWHEIIARLHKHLLETDPDYQIFQIKEKFGGLRFYTDGLSEDGYKAVNEAEAESFMVCEECGEPGDLDTRTYWVKTLCETHKNIRRQLEQARKDSTPGAGC